MLLIVFLSACTTLDPYTGEKKTSNAAKGAGIGAATGVAVGLITGDDSAERKKHALILAGIGALAGSGVGHYMDRQEMELRQQLEGSGVSVVRDGDNITLNMPGNVTFGVDSSEINGSFYSVLDSVAIVLNEYDQTLVEIAGHTDSTGSDQYNYQLSQKRSASVVTFLSYKDVRLDRMISVGVGETMPLADNNSELGREQNRRVEITIVPVTA